MREKPLQPKTLKNDIKYKLTLDEDQKKVKEAIYNCEIVVITGRAGCLALGTEVLMYDGSFKKVEDITVGDKLMGVDSTPRNVLELKRGKEQMYWVRQSRAEDYRVNESHILSLKRVQPVKYPRITTNGKRHQDFTKQPIHDKKVTTVNINVADYLKIGNKKQYMGYISPCLEFIEKELPIDPYYLGLWLGDGNKRDIKQITNTDPEIIKYLKSLGCELYSKKHDKIAYYFKDECIKLNEKFLKLYNLTNIAFLPEKYIPEDYLLNSKENRLNLLAGLIDSDGHYIKEGKYYEIIQKNKRISEQIAFLSRSLGYKTNIRPKKAKMNREDGSVYTCEVYRISIMPSDIIPVLIERKKNVLGSNFKNRSHHGIRIEKDIVDDYYGFTLDGDNLFILKDFTVTHNSGKSLVTAQTVLDMMFKKHVGEVFITRAAVEVGKSLGFLPGELNHKFDPYIEAFRDNLYKCYDKEKVDKHIQNGQIQGMPVQYIRGKTIDAGQVLVVEEAQNLTKGEILAILTRLGKGGKIIINGDNDQIDTKETYTGLSYAIDLAKNIDEIYWFKLKSNHRSELLEKIFNFEYNRVAH